MASTSLIEKLRKVLAMTESPNENEATTAMAMLNTLLTQHNLSIVDLEKRGSAAPKVHESGHDLGKAAFKWKLNLATAIADHYYCYALVDDIKKTVVFIGRPDNVESLRMLYQWLIDQIRRIAGDERRVYIAANPDDHIDPLRWQVQFGIGIVPRLRTRLNELKLRQQDEQTTALVIHHAAEVSDYLEEKFGYRADGQDTANQRKWRKQREEDEQLKASDPEAYFARYPWARPEVKTPEQVAADAKRQRAANAKWERKWARQQEREEERRYNRSPEQRRKDEQGATARYAGRDAAERVNLQPFITGKVDNKTKLGGA